MWDPYECVAHPPRCPITVNVITSTLTDLDGSRAEVLHRPACCSRKMSVCTAKLEQRSKDLFLNGPASELLHKGGEDPVQTIPVPASPAEAVDRVLSGLKYLAAADPTALAARVQAECLYGLEQADAIATAARARILAAFSVGHGYSDDAD